MLKNNIYIYKYTNQYIPISIQQKNSPRTSRLSPSGELCGQGHCAATKSGASPCAAGVFNSWTPPVEPWHPNLQKKMGGLASNVRFKIRELFLQNLKKGERFSDFEFRIQNSWRAGSNVDGFCLLYIFLETNQKFHYIL